MYRQIPRNVYFFFFSSRRRHTRCYRDWSSTCALPIFTGGALAEQVGVGWTESIHPGDRDRFVAVYREAVAARTPLQAEFRLRRADGEYRWVLASGVPRIEADGAFAGLIGSCVDITETRQAREVLQAARDEL